MMDATAGRARENPLPPSPSPPCSSPSALDELFDKFFDWPAFSGAPPRPIDDASSHYPSPPSSDEPPSPVSVAAGYSPSCSPLFARGLSIQDLEAGLLRMRAPYDDAAAAAGSDYSGQATPELVHGADAGGTSPSDHSGSLALEPVDDGPFALGVTLREAQAHDDEWTYPQTHMHMHMPKPGPRPYPPRLHVHGGEGLAEAPPLLLPAAAADAAAAAQSAGQKRRRSGADPEKRQRQLVDPVQTADVRKSGACLPCRVTKTRVRRFPPWRPGPSRPPSLPC